MEKEFLFFAFGVTRGKSAARQILFLFLIFAPISIVTSCSTKDSNLTPFGDVNAQALILVQGPSLFDFGQQLIDSQTIANFTIVNSGSVAATQISASLAITAFRFTGGVYPGTGGTCGTTLAPGAECVISITFSPLYVSQFSDAITISYFNGVAFALFSNPQIAGTGAYGTSGSLDLSLNGRGSETISLSSGAGGATSVLVNSDRSVLLAGATTFGSQSDFALVKVNSDGSTFSSFGNGGNVTTDFASGNDQINDLAAQVDGKLVAAGMVTIAGVSQIGLARYSANGLLDTTFGNLGRVTSVIGSGASTANVVLVQPDSNLVIAGNTSNGTNTDAVLVRYLPSGAVDPSFANSGVNIQNFGGNDSFQSVAIQMDLSLVAVGYSSNGTNDDFLIARYTGAGALDSSFGTGGHVLVDFGGTDHAFGVAIQTDGKIVVVGSSESPAQQVAIARLLSNGALDTTFGTGGKVVFSPTTAGGSAASVLLQANGDIVFAGGCSNGVVQQFLAGRLLPSGSLDTTFGMGGLAIVPVGSGNATGTSIYQETNGKFVVGGYATVGTSPNFAMIRLWP